MLLRGTNWITGFGSSEYERGNLISVYKNLKGGYKEDRPGSFQYYSVEGQKATRTDKEVSSEHQETIFAVGLTKCWSRLPREVAKSLSMKVFKSCLDTILRNML